MEYLITTTNGELYHHGILGQKWGVRRYQNPDGTLTEAGKRRVGKGKYTRESLNRWSEDKSRFDSEWSNYRSKKEAYKIAKKSGDKEAKKNAKIDVRLARGDALVSTNRLVGSRRRFRESEQAEAGRELVSKGKTLIGSTAQASSGKALIVAGLGFLTAGKILKSYVDVTHEDYTSAINFLGATGILTAGVGYVAATDGVANKKKIEKYYQYDNH